MRWCSWPSTFRLSFLMPSSFSVPMMFNCMRICRTSGGQCQAMRPLRRKKIGWQQSTELCVRHWSMGSGSGHSVSKESFTLFELSCLLKALFCVEGSHPLNITSLTTFITVIIIIRVTSEKSSIGIFKAFDYFIP